MSDRLGALFDVLHGQHPPAQFAPAAAVRRRGRQRARRQAVMAGVAVLAVAGLGTGGLVTLTGPTDAPPAPAASSPVPGTPTTAPPSPPGPAPTALGQERLLTGNDLGPGDWQRLTSHELLQDWWWACPARASSEVTSLTLRVDVDAAAWRTGPQGVHQGSMDQIVELFEPGAGRDYLEDVRTSIRVCTDGPPAAEEAAPTDHTIVGEGFVGDESLLVRTDLYGYEGESINPDPNVILAAVVRVGDLVTTVSMFAAPAGEDVAPGAEDFLREVAARAADRLR